jgi:hypothetical protein
LDAYGDYDYDEYVSELADNDCEDDATTALERSVEDMALTDWAQARVLDGAWVTPADLYHKAKVNGLGEFCISLLASLPCLSIKLAEIFFSSCRAPRIRRKHGTPRTLVDLPAVIAPARRLASAFLSTIFHPSSSSRLYHNDHPRSRHLHFNPRHAPRPTRSTRTCALTSPTHARPR